MDRTNNTVAIESEYIAIDNVNNSISNYLGNYMPKWMADSAGFVAQEIIFTII